MAGKLGKAGQWVKNDLERQASFYKTSAWFRLRMSILRFFTDWIRIPILDSMARSLLDDMINAAQKKAQAHAKAKAENKLTQNSSDDGK